MREKEERKWLQNRKKFKYFREMREMLMRAGIFGKDRPNLAPKHLIIRDTTCGGKRRVPILDLLDQNPLYARRRRLNLGVNVIDEDAFSDASTEASAASLPGSIPDDVTSPSLINVKKLERVLTVGLTSATSVRNRRHSEPSMTVKSMTSMYTHTGLTPR